MQKTNIKASILIWAIFLSLIISVTFISVSTKINKNLRENYSLTDKINLENEIGNIINSWSIDWNFTSQYLNTNEKIIFDSSARRILSLKQWESHISKINNDSDISIKILNWWPLIYENNSSTWIISNTAIFTVTAWDLNLYNLWGYTKFWISSDIKTNFLSEYTNYKIIKKIWNKEIIKSKWTIKNF